MLNTVPNVNTDDTPNQDQYFGQNDQTPYREGISIPMPQPMAGNVSEDNLYPLESSTETPNLNIANRNDYSPTNNYAEGGRVKSHRKKNSSKFPNLYPTLAEMIREQGGEEDTILAHINPLEAQILGLMANGGRINPVTGLPQFGLFRNPGKWLKSNLGGIGGTILGNMILPGIGGVIGGALGGAAGSAVRGRKDYLQSGLRGAAMGAVTPTLAGLAGTGASALGMNTAGNYLSNYAAQNAILPSLGIGGGGVAAGSGSGMGEASTLSNMISPGSNMTASAGTGGMAPSAGFMSKLGANTSNFLSQPANLLTLASVAGSMANRPKEKSPERLAEERKRFNKALALTPEERAREEANLLAEEQMNRRIARNKYLPEERFSVGRVFRKIHTPEEYKDKKNWLQYYDNAQFSGNPLPMKMGGQVPRMRFEEEEIEYPSGIGFHLKGYTGGQDDKIPAKLSDGEYVIPADVVSHAGDGNNDAGAKKFDALLKNIRKAKGGRINLPPKARSLASYMMR